MTIELSDLSPKIKFCPMSPEANFELSFQIKKSAMGPIIMQKWAWDEAYQRNIHRQRLNEKPFYFIQRNNRTIGTLSLLCLETYVRFGECYLLSELHRQGLGTKTLQYCLALTDEECLPVRLEYLKWNPVGTLYERHGFRIIGESDILVYGTGRATSCPCFSNTKRLIMSILENDRTAAIAHGTAARGADGFG